MDRQKRIIDKRRKEKFMMDDAYLNGYARLCGIYATGVYMSLCRHSNKDQFCFPSIRLMGEELNISINSVKKGINQLEAWKLIEIERKKKANGRWKNNTYILLDKLCWKPKPVQSPDKSMEDNHNPVMTKPEPCDDDLHSPVETNKETNDKGNTYKETHNTSNASVAGKDINEIMKLFNNINPTLNWANKTYRNSIAELIKKFGFKDTLAMTEQALSIQGKSYAPVVANPYQMKEKLAQLKFYFERQKSENERKGVVIL